MRGQAAASPPSFQQTTSPSPRGPPGAARLPRRPAGVFPKGHPAAGWHLVWSPSQGNRRRAPRWLAPRGFAELEEAQEENEIALVTSRWPEICCQWSHPGRGRCWLRGLCPPSAVRGESVRGRNQGGDRRPPPACGDAYSFWVTATALGALSGGRPRGDVLQNPSSLSLFSS